jgi:putative alpha-1,2-mannosidase
MMGFYPVTPGMPWYTIGSPVFEQISVKLENGNVFTVKADGASEINKYIQSAKFNGKAMETPWFSHEKLMNGGTLQSGDGPKTQ